MFRVCNEFPTKISMDAVYNVLGEAMERKRELRELFDTVLTLLQAKPDTLNTPTS